ncbi:MAG TPA: dodecin [Phenylobacterium sp.]
MGPSETSVEDAIRVAIARVAGTKRNVRWFEVPGPRGQVEDGRVAHFQVTLKVGFTLDEK